MVGRKASLPALREGCVLKHLDALFDKYIINGRIVPFLWSERVKGAGGTIMRLPGNICRINQVQGVLFPGNYPDRLIKRLRIKITGNDGRTVACNFFDFPEQ